MYYCASNHISKHLSEKRVSRNQHQNSMGLTRYFNAQVNSPTNGCCQLLQKSIRSSMYHASRKWWGTIAEYKQVYLNWMRKAHFGSDQNKPSIHMKNIYAVAGSRKSSSSGKTPLQKMRPRNQPLFFSSFRSFILKGNAIFMGEGMLWSNPNPLIYVIGSSHSYSQLKSQ